MMFPLPMNVVFDRLEIGPAYRKCAVSGLPCETGYALGLHPFRSAGFYRFDDIGGAPRASQVEQNVDVIFNSADQFRGRPALVIEHLCHVRVEIRCYCLRDQR